MKQIFKLMILAVLPFFAVACASDSNEIKVVSFNLRYSNPDDGENWWENRKSATINMVNEIKPDVMGTQECLAEMADYIEENLPTYARLGVGRDDGDRVGEMMAIFYNTDRLDLISFGNFWLSETPDSVSLGWDGACRRMVTWGCFRVKETENIFYHFNTHLDHIGPMARQEGVKLLTAKIGEIVPEGVPFAVTGDFNSTVDEPIYDPLKALALSVRDVAPVTDSKNTYNAYGANTGAVIDHVFEANLKPISFTTLDKDFGAPFISDHYPVEAILSFEK